MSNIDTLTMGKDGFGANPQNINKQGRPKGAKNRSTIMREILALAELDGKSKEYHMNNSIIQKAIDGDVSAFKEIQDTMYGKIADKVLTAETDAENLGQDVTEEALKHLPTDVLEQLMENKNDSNV